MADDNQIKPGYTTTEFWLTLFFVAFVCAAVGVQLHQGKLGLDTAIMIVGAAIAKTGYSVSRGLAKSQGPGQDQAQI